MMQIIECEQGTEAWFRARMGMPTASEFHTLLAVGRDGGASKTRRAYLHRLAAEIIMGEPCETYSNHHMERGHAMEDEARDLYAFTEGVEPRRVGFIINGSKGCSPDSLIGDAGMLEIKTKLPELLIGCLVKDEFPPENKAQCQGALWVAEREWIDLAVFCPKLPLFVKRTHRDEAYIKKLSEAVDLFNNELQQTVRWLRKQYGPPEPEPDPERGRDWSDLPPASQVVLACQRADFREFLSSKLEPDCPTLDEAAAQETVKWFCGVKRKRDIAGSPTALAKWGEIYETFDAERRWGNAA